MSEIAIFKANKAFIDISNNTTNVRSSLTPDDFDKIADIVSANLETFFKSKNIFLERVKFEIIEI